MNGNEANTPPHPQIERLQQRSQSRLTALLLSIELSWRVQLGLIALGYAVILGHWIFVNHLSNSWSAAHPADDMASLSVPFLHFFHACSLMIPTIWLIRVMSKFERVYTAFSNFLVWFSLTAPVLLALFLVSPRREMIADPFIMRLLASPFVLLGIAISRLMARSGQAKRLTVRALVIEGVTLVIAVALFFTWVVTHRTH